MTDTKTHPTRSKAKDALVEDGKGPFFPGAPQTPPVEVPMNVVIAGIVLAILAFFASVIGFLSTKQAPPAPPVVEQNTK